MNDHLKENDGSNEGQIEDLASKYPHGFTAKTLQQWARVTKFSGSFEAYLPGSGEKRGKVTITNIGPSDGQLKIEWAEKNFALLPDGGENDPVYLSPETMSTLGIPLDFAITGKNHGSADKNISKELALVQAERRVREAASKKGISPETYAKLEKDLGKARAAVHGQAMEQIPSRKEHSNSLE